MPLSCDNSLNWPYLPALTHLSVRNYAPHAILMMAVISPPTDTVKTKTSGPDGLTFAPLFAMLWLEYMN